MRVPICDDNNFHCTFPECGCNRQEQHSIQNNVAQAMAKEYQEWIDFYHAGNGSYDDFLRNKLRTNS